MKKKFFLIAILLIATVVFSACGSYADVVLYLGGDTPVYELHLYLEHGERAVLEDTAAERGVKKTAYNPFFQNVIPDAEWVPGAPWRVEEYVRALVMSTNTGGFVYKKTDTASVNGYRVMIFELAVNYDSPEWARTFTGDTLWEEHTEEIGNNGFIRTFEVTFDNPFAGFRSEYDRADAGTSGVDLFYGLKHGVTAKWSPTTETQTAAQIGETAERDGWELVSSETLTDKTDQAGNPAVRYHYERMKLPAFFEAFPVSEALQNPDNFTSNFVISTFSRFFVGAPAVKKTDPQTGQYYYLYPSEFSADAETVRFTYRRPAAAGWLIVALLCGGLAVGIVFAVAAYRKKRPKTVPPAPPLVNGYETFGAKPLDPFDFDDKKVRKPFDPFE